MIARARAALPVVAEDNVRDLHGSGLVAAGRGVRVDRQGIGHVGVADAVADDFGVDAGIEGEGGVGVPDVVETDSRTPARSTSLLNRRVMVSGWTGVPSGWHMSLPWFW